MNVQAASPNRRWERRLRSAGYRHVAGVDEVGRGPLAGPLVAGAVVLYPETSPPWMRELRDSKQLAAARREALAPAIKAGVRAWGIGWVPPQEVDALGVAAATHLAMRRALAACATPPDYALVDGNGQHRFACPHETIVGGDAQVASIAAASIIAKVARDAALRELHSRFDCYEFARNKGYGTPAHLIALARYGPCPEHRFSFAPVRAASRDALYRAPVTGAER